MKEGEEEVGEVRGGMKMGLKGWKIGDVQKEEEIHPNNHFSFPDVSNDHQTMDDRLKGDLDGRCLESRSFDE